MVTKVKKQKKTKLINPKVKQIKGDIKNAMEKIQDVVKSLKDKA